MFGPSIIENMPDGKLCVIQFIFSTQLKSFLEAPPVVEIRRRIRETDRQGVGSGNTKIETFVEMAWIWSICLNDILQQVRMILGDQATDN